MKRYPATKDHKAERISHIRTSGKGTIMLRQCGDSGLLLVTDWESNKQVLVHLTEKAIEHLRLGLRKP